MLNEPALLKRGLLLEYATLGWNVAGSAIVIVAAVAAHSVALAGFGLDSLIEIVASVVVVWELKGINQGRERLALHSIGTAFFALALYILAQAVYTLAHGSHPGGSRSGILWLGATFIVMLLLAYGKRLTGRELGNRVLQTEARVTLIDAVLAGSVLIGLVLNAAFGLWWADVLAGLVIVYYGLREGWGAWHE